MVAARATTTTGARNWLVIPNLSLTSGPGSGLRSLRSLVVHSPCTLLVVISTECGFCKRMRVTWPTEFPHRAQSVGAPVRTAWIAPDSWDEITEFFRGWPLDFVEALRFEHPDLAWKALGVFGTPTSYLVDQNGRVRFGTIGLSFPPDTVGRRVCSGP